MTVNLSSNNMNDILMRVKRNEATKLRAERNKDYSEKQINRIEKTGFIDAIDYAPERKWSDLFVKTPVFKSIDKSFIDKNDSLKESYKKLEDIQEVKKFPSSLRNLALGISIPSVITGMALLPLSQVAGMGYLAAFGANALVTGGVTAAAAGIAEVGNQLFYNKSETEALDNFVKDLTNQAKNNLTDMHKYWNAADKLSKLSMGESDILETLSGLYTEANKHLQANHNVSLTDVYLSADDKNALKNYKKLDGHYIAHSLHKDMTSVPDNLKEGLPSYIKVRADLNHDQARQKMVNVINLKIKALEDIGITIDVNKMKKDNNNDIRTINKHINDKYGSVLDNALLLYQGKKSMAAPIVDKVEKMLQNALTAYSKEVARQAKLNNLNNVPQLTSDLVGKIFSRIMLQVALPANDTKLSKILKAMSDTTAMKVAANLNTYSPDSAHAKQQKELYGKSFLDDVYCIKVIEHTNDMNDFVNSYNPSKASLKQLQEIRKKPQYQQKNIVYEQEANRLSEKIGKTIWNTRGYFGFGDATLKTRRENGLGWTRIPYIGTKKYDDPKIYNDIRDRLNSIK